MLSPWHCLPLWNNPSNEHVSTQDRDSRVFMSWHEATQHSRQSPERGKVRFQCSTFDLALLTYHLRYCNMDYLFYQGLVGSESWPWLYHMILPASGQSTYDDAWITLTLPSISSVVAWTFGILSPKFHLPAHVVACHTGMHSTTQKVWAGQMARPRVQLGRSESLGTKHKRNGPRISAWHTWCSFWDYTGESWLAWVRNYHWSCVWAFDKYPGSSVLRKMKAAMLDMHDHIISHEEYQHSLPKASVAQWILDVETWEKDPSHSKPFWSQSHK